MGRRKLFLRKTATCNDTGWLDHRRHGRWRGQTLQVFYLLQYDLYDTSTKREREREQREYKQYNKKNNFKNTKSLNRNKFHT